MKNLKKSIIFSFVVIPLFLTQIFGAIIENFDTGNWPGSWTSSGSVSMPSGNWYTYTNTIDGNDFINDNQNGAYCLRIRAPMSSNPSKPAWFMSPTNHSAGIVKFNYKRYGDDSGVVIRVEYWTNGVWQQLGNQINTTNVTSWTPWYATLNITNRVVIRFVYVSGPSGARWNLDDFYLSDWSQTGDGTGSAIISPATVYTGKTVTISNTIFASNYKLATVSIVVPSDWTGLALGNVSYSAGTPHLNGNEVIISNINIETNSYGWIKIANLKAPSIEKTSIFTNKTAGSNGTLEPILIHPAISVVAPNKLRIIANSSGPLNDGVVNRSGLYSNIYNISYDVGIYNGIGERAFMSFNLGNIPTNAIITTATLYIYQFGQRTNSNPPNKYWPSVGKMVVDNVDYGNTFEVSDFDCAAISNNLGIILQTNLPLQQWGKLDVKDAIQYCINHPKSWNVGGTNRYAQFRLRLLNDNDTSPGDYRASRILSANYSAGAYGPYIVVRYYVPSQPGISTVTPSTGYYGMSVTISGSNFGPSQTLANGKVFFNGVDAGIADFWSDTSITIKVPDSTSGNVIVQTRGGNSNPVSFYYAKPVITNLNPSSGQVGSIITIEGSNFGIAKGNYGKVTYSNLNVSVISWSNKKITIEIPADAPDNGNIYVTNAGGKSSGMSFDILQPQITTVTKVTAGRGDAVYIEGNYFGKYQGTTGKISLTNSEGNFIATVITWNSNRIDFYIPNNVTKGSNYGVKVITTGGGSYKSNLFYITDAKPVITASVSPLKGNTNTSFVFSAIYKDIDGDECNTNSYPLLYILTNGAIKSSNKMNYYSGTEVTNTGKTYRVTLSGSQLGGDSTNYSFYVVAQAQTGNQSIVTSATVNAPDIDSVPPANVNIISKGATKNSISLKWNKIIDAIQYKIYWGKTTGYELGSATITATNYTITGLQPGTLYYFKITSIDDYNNESSGTAGTISTEKIELPAGVLVYPNPAEKGEIIKFEGVKSGTKIKIYTITGEFIKEVENEWRPESGIASGVYVAVFEDKNGTKQKVKFIYGVKR